MFRIIWFFGCLIVAMLLAVIGKSLVPILVSEMSTEGISHGIYDLLSRSGVVRVAVVAGLFIIFFTLLGQGGLALNDGLTMRRFAHQLRQRRRRTAGDGAISQRDFFKIASDAGDLAEPARSYGASGAVAESEVMRTPFAADQFFDAHTQISGRLHLWFFKQGLAVSIALGAILALLSMVSGVDDVVFQSQVPLRPAVNGLLPALQAGLLAFVIMVGAGIATKLLCALIVDLRSGQLVRFNSLLDSLFRASPSAMEDLSAPLNALSEAQALLAKDRTAQMATVIDKAVATLQSGFAGEFSKQIKSTGKMLEETEKQVTKSTVAVEAAHDVLAKYARGQSAAIDKAVAAALNSYYKDDQKTRAAYTKSLTQTVETATKAVEESSNKSAETLESALTALNASYAGGLTETAEALRNTQRDIARLAEAVTQLAAKSHSNLPQPREDYLRLVGDDGLETDPPPLGQLDLSDDDSDESSRKVEDLAQNLRSKSGGSTAASGPKSKELSSALKDLKNKATSSDLPEL